MTYLSRRRRFLEAVVLLTASILGLCLNACETTRTPADELDLPSEPVVPELGDTPPERKSFPTQRKLRGFDLSGAAVCWSLLPEFDCITRPDPVVTACEQAGGRLLYCDDCRLLCSVDLTPTP